MYCKWVAVFIWRGVSPWMRNATFIFCLCVDLWGDKGGGTAGPTSRRPRLWALPPPLGSRYCMENEAGIDQLFKMRHPPIVTNS